MRSHQLLGVTDQGIGRLVSWAICFRDGCFYCTLEWEVWLIWERSEVLGGLHGGCNEWVRSLCGGSELWLGSAMPSWRMAGWLWRMAEASWKSLRWWRRGREERGSGEGGGMEKRGRSCWEGELSRLMFFPLRLRSSGALIAEINERDWRERGLDSENDPTISFSFCELLIARTARAVEDVHVFCEWESNFPFEIASIWKCMIGVVSCRIAVWMCLTSVNY